MEYVSYGGGAPSLALIILNIQGKIKPITKRDTIDEIIFVDTGWEDSDTIKNLAPVKEYVEKHGVKFTILEPIYGSLETYLENSIPAKKDIPIPYFMRNKENKPAMARRQCTGHWKIRTINQYIKQNYSPCGRVVQLGIHAKEWQRMRDAKYKRDINRYPLVDLDLSRSDCQTIVSEAGLPSLPKSGCVGCPYLPPSRLIDIKTRNPKDFERALKIDKLLQKQGKGLHHNLRPLDKVISQQQFDLGELDYSCESGYCFV